MKPFKRSVWFSALALGLLWLVGCTSQRDITVLVAANTSLTPWLTEAVQQFNQSRASTAGGKTIGVVLLPVEAGQAVADITSGSSNPDLWVPDAPVWADVLTDKGNVNYTGDCVSTARSPLVIALWRPIAESLGWPGRPLGWLDVGSLAADPSAWAYYSGGQFGSSLRLGHTHPGLSGAGSSTLLAVVQSALSSKDAVSAEDVQKPVVQASVGAFESAVSSFGTSEISLGQAMRDRGIRYLGAGILYENTVVEFGQADPGLVAVYPSEGTFMATHPACVNQAASPEQKEAARVFRDYLLGEKGQALAMTHGLRPADENTATIAPLDAAHGVDLTQPAVIFGQPSVASLYAAQSLWKVTRKPVNVVMVLDTSGSMSGEKIETARVAAADFVQHMGDTDHFSLITFNTYNEPKMRINFEFLLVKTDRQGILDTLKSQNPNGGTPLCDAIGLAAEVIARHRASTTVNIIIVLTDGLDNESERFSFNQDLFTVAGAYETMVYTIAYGSDADEDSLGWLADATNGKFYQGTTANIGDIYSDMSAAFGGSAGIGR